MSEGKKSRVTAVGFRHTPDGAVEFLGDASPEDKARILEDLQASMSFQAKRRELWGDIGPGAMSRLAKMFPTLQDADGVAPWDAMRLLEWLCGPAPGTGAKWAGLFVLGVWHDLDWSEEAKHLPRRSCPDCGGVGRLDREVGGRVRAAARPGEFVRDDYDDDGRIVGERVVATDRCACCEGEGTYVPSLGRDGRFNIYSAFSSWDEKHVAAFHAWTRYPFYP